MAKPYADIPGFKKLDAALRDAVVAHKAVMVEIEKSRAGKRTAKEITMLDTVQADTNAALLLASKARSSLWDGVG